MLTRNVATDMMGTVHGIGYGRSARTPGPKEEIGKVLDSLIQAKPAHLNGNTRIPATGKTRLSTGRARWRDRHAQCRLLLYFLDISNRRKRRGLESGDAVHMAWHWARPDAEEDARRTLRRRATGAGGRFIRIPGRGFDDVRSFYFLGACGSLTQETPHVSGIPGSATLQARWTC